MAAAAGVHCARNAIVNMMRQRIKTAGAQSIREAANFPLYIHLANQSIMSCHRIIEVSGAQHIVPAQAGVSSQCDKNRHQMFSTRNRNFRF